MKVAQLIHNPGAGNEDHSKKKLVKWIEDAGYRCRYLSTKDKGWEIDFEADILIVAGGDGTVRNVTRKLLDREQSEKNIPLALVPLGTANNIAKTLDIDHDVKKLIKALPEAKSKKFDVGKVHEIENAGFFLESFGYGIFPYLMKKMKELGKEEEEKPEKQLQSALKLLYDIILSYEARHCELRIDGTDHSGKFILAEVMNTSLLGPNLGLSPNADPGDGEFEVILVPETQKDKFAAFVLHKMEGDDEEDNFHFHTLKGKEIEISWQGTHVHVDDEIIKIKEATKVKIELKAGILNFLC